MYMEEREELQSKLDEVVEIVLPGRRKGGKPQIWLVAVVKEDMQKVGMTVDAFMHLFNIA